MNEQLKYDVIKKIADHPETANKDRAAMTLGCTRRHINRLLKGYLTEGKAFFIHGNAGRAPSTKIPSSQRQLIIDLYNSKYSGSNFTHFTELLAKHEDIHVSVSTVASILEAQYILSPKVRRARN